MGGSWWKAAFAGLIMAAQWTGAASANSFIIGQTYEGALTLNGSIRAPLLSGRWEVIGVSEHYATTGSSYSSPINNVVMAQIVDDRLKAVIYVTYNERSLTNGWNGQDSNCRRKDILHTLMQIDKQTVKLCDYVNHNVFSISEKSAKWWADSINTLAKKGMHFPGSWLQAGIWASNRSDFVFVAYNFNPEFLGLPEDKERWEMSSWHKVRISDSPPRKAFADAIAAWADSHLEDVNQGVNESWPKDKALDWPTAFVAPSTPVAPPTLTAAPASSSATTATELEGKFAELKALHDKKLISDEDYAAKRKALLDRL